MSGCPLPPHSPPPSPLGSTFIYSLFWTEPKTKPVQTSLCLTPHVLFKPTLLPSSLAMTTCTFYWLSWKKWNYPGRVHPIIHSEKSLISSTLCSANVPVCSCRLPPPPGGVALVNFDQILILFLVFFFSLIAWTKTSFPFDRSDENSGFWLDSLKRTGYFRSQATPQFFCCSLFFLWPNYVLKLTINFRDTRNIKCVLFTHWTCALVNIVDQNNHPPEYYYLHV